MSNHKTWRYWRRRLSEILLAQGEQSTNGWGWPFQCPRSKKAQKKEEDKQVKTKLNFEICAYGNIYHQDSDGREHDLLLLLGSLEHLQHCRPLCKRQWGDQSSCGNFFQIFCESFLYYVKSPGDNVNSLHSIPLLCHELCLLKSHYVSISARKYFQVACKSVAKWRTRIYNEIGKNSVT